VEVAANRPRLTLAAGLLLTALLSGCSSSPPSRATLAGASLATGSRATHTVERGDTLYRIAQEYGTTTDALIQANALTDPRALEVGQVLTIPGRDLAASDGLSDQWVIPPRADRQFIWPVAAGTVSSPFGMRNGVMHDGVDISAPAGTPVIASDDAVVIYCGHLRGYGNVVILQHTGGYVTVYGHNQRNLVRDGDRVTRGEEIAELGATGRASGPNLHFEVRCDNHPENPLAYLPVPEPRNRISFARYTGD